MRLTFLGKSTTGGQSPTLYSSDRDTYVLQGWVVDNPDLLAELRIGGNERAIEIPSQLMEFLAEDGLAGPVVNHVPPLVHVTTNGNYIVQGSIVTDPEALSTMDMPPHETCIEVTKASMRRLIGR